jgi:hypothetical protein
VAGRQDEVGLAAAARMAPHPPTPSPSRHQLLFRAADLAVREHPAMAWLLQGGGGQDEAARRAGQKIPRHANAGWRKIRRRMRTAGGGVSPRGVLLAAGICPAERDAAVRETPGVTCKKNQILNSVADPGCLSRIRLLSIPDPNCFHPGSRIRIKEFKYFNPKKWFLSCRKYDAGCSSQIPDPDPDFLPIPDPGVKKA